MNYIPPLWKEAKIVEFKPLYGFVCEEDEFIAEAAGSFPEQEKYADKIADTVMLMIDNGMKSFEIVIPFYGEEMKFEIELNLGLLCGGVKAQVEPYGTVVDGKAVIDRIKLTLGVPHFSRYANGASGLKCDIAAAVAHEIGHSGIFSMRAVAGQNIDDMPSWYGSIIKILNQTPQNFKRDIAYALYASYYQERQAIISSVYTQLQGSIGDKIKNEFEFGGYDAALVLYKKMLCKTEAYETYWYIANVTCKKILAMDDKNAGKIEADLAKDGISFKNGLKAMFKQVEAVSRAALKDVCRAGARFFHDNIKNNEEK